MDEDIKIIVKKVMWGFVFLSLLTVIALAVLFPAYFPITQTQPWKDCGSAQMGVCSVDKKPTSDVIPTVQNPPTPPPPAIASKPLPEPTPKVKSRW